jgi:hypothetical protein
MITPPHAVGALLAILAALPRINALGCYSGGLPFEDLHGGIGINNLDMDGEVLADINTVCNTVNGAVFKKGDPPFTHCSEWTVTVEPDDSCYELCVPDETCDPNCGGPVVGSINHIDWQISHNNDNAESTMTWDICNSAFSTELGGCDTGSEQVHDGFFWKVDPNAGACPKPEDPQNPKNPGNYNMAYYVYPVDGRDNSQIEEIASNLQRYVAFGGKLEASETRTFGLNYWRIPSLTVEEAIEVGNITNVRLPRECVFTSHLPILISRK